MLVKKFDDPFVTELISCDKCVFYNSLISYFSKKTAKEISQPLLLKFAVCRGRHFAHTASGNGAVQ